MNQTHSLSDSDLEEDNPEVNSEDEAYYSANGRRQPLAQRFERQDSGNYSLAPNAERDPVNESLLQNSVTKATAKPFTSWCRTTLENDATDECYYSMKCAPFVSQEDDQLTEVLESCRTTLSKDKNPLLTSLFRRDSELNTVLHWTIILGWVRDSLLMIRCMPDPYFLEMRNELRQTPLILALLTRQCPVVNALVKAGVDLTKTDRRGDSCFHIIAKTGDLDSLVILRKSMTSSLRQQLVNQQNHSGLCPVHIAIIEGHIGIAEQFRRLGADINSKDGRAGYTPIHHAIRIHRDTKPQIMRYLVEQAEVNLSLEDFNRRTPLMFAAGHRCVQTVAYLVKKGSEEDRHWLNCPPCSDGSDSDDSESGESDIGR